MCFSGNVSWLLQDWIVKTNLHKQSFMSENNLTKTKITQHQCLVALQCRSVPKIWYKLRSVVAKHYCFSFRFLHFSKQNKARTEKIVCHVLWKLQNVIVEKKTISSTLVNKDTATFQICTKLKLLLKHLILLWIKLYQLELMIKRNNFS